jgi:hypothetical protein
MERIGSSGSAAGCAGGGEGATVASPASRSEFDLAPSIWQPHTRAVYWRAWCLVATWRLGAFLLALGADLSTSPRR